MSKYIYPTDLTDKEWEIVSPYLPPACPTGRPRELSLRDILKAIFYPVRTGCQWRMLPKDYPAWPSVYYYWRSWRLNGSWQKLHDCLHQANRLKAGRDKEPSAAIVDSQSVKTTGIGGSMRGYDGGKKVKGRKRHILVNTQGLVIRVYVYAADLTEAGGLKLLLTPLKDLLPRLKLIWADGGYKESVDEWVKQTFGWTLEIVRHPWAGLKGVWAPKDAVIDWNKIKPKGFHILPRRWVIERTFS